MPAEIVINATLPEVRIALIEDGEITSLSHEYEKNKGVVGNVYKGRVSRVLPGMQAAFVDIGLKRAAFLYAGDVVVETDEPAVAKRTKDRAGIKDSGARDADIEIVNPGAYLEDKNLEQLSEKTDAAADDDDDDDEDEDSESGDSESEEDSGTQARPEKKERGRGPRRPRGRRRIHEKPPEIADVLHEGQEILVQVTKEEMGTKGARLTCHIALPGRHVVLMPTVDHVGVSRKIASAEERHRLRDTINELRPPGMGFIVRTMAEGATREQITNEVNYLLGLYSDIKRKREKAKYATLLHEDLSAILRTVRDQFTNDIYRLVIDSPRVFDFAVEYVGSVAPTLKNRIVRYTGKDPIFDAYGINSEISRALNRKVWLRSGGYLIIDQAEALTVIDVNTGKFIGKKSFEDTILKTNLEAVSEVAYQLRIRDAGGIIIIDLIDMERSSHREQVYRALEHALRKDKAKTNILRISELGLMQMTRKRTKESLTNIFCEPCPYCKGNGFVKNIKTICFDIFREIERTALEGGITGANVTAHPEVVDHLLHRERDTLDRLEERFGMKVSISGNESLHLEAYEVQGERLTIARS